MSGTPPNHWSMQELIIYILWTTYFQFFAHCLNLLHIERKGIRKMSKECRMSRRTPPQLDRPSQNDGAHPNQWLKICIPHHQNQGYQLSCSKWVMGVSLPFHIPFRPTTWGNCFLLSPSAPSRGKQRFLLIKEMHPHSHTTSKATQAHKWSTVSPDSPSIVSFLQHSKAAAPRESHLEVHEKTLT